MTDISIATLAMTVWKSESEIMKNKSIFFIFISFLLGVILGEIHGRLFLVPAAENASICFHISEYTENFRLLEDGNVVGARRRLGQRIWSMVEYRNTVYSNEFCPRRYIECLPDAQRIINLVSNEDQQTLLGPPPPLN